MEGAKIRKRLTVRTNLLTVSHYESQIDQRRIGSKTYEDVGLALIDLEGDEELMADAR